MCDVNWINKLSFIAGASVSSYILYCTQTAHNEYLFSFKHPVMTTICLIHTLTVTKKEQSNNSHNNSRDQLAERVKQKFATMIIHLFQSHYNFLGVCHLFSFIRLEYFVAFADNNFSSKLFSNTWMFMIKLRRRILFQLHHCSVCLRAPRCSYKTLIAEHIFIWRCNFVVMTFTSQQICNKCDTIL